ncbi:MAG TPA: ABC transporter substrate-binding protein [Chloroflexota bacterium]|nr:ABC transporter substrate-binding protein [Chloroflexota bacterium]
MTIAIGAELNNLATKLEGGNTFASEFDFLSNSPLTVKDAHGSTSPLLAADRPSRDAGTWTVNPDGTMTTVWKIRDNARWHDGVAVTSSDFIFAFRVYTDNAIPVRDRDPERFIDHLDAQDDHTFTVYWKQSYPWANELGAGQLEPLPDHILGSLYTAGDPDAFMNNAFWSSTAYVGEGPYVLHEWNPGAQLVYQAFDDYFMGRPKIDEVVFRIISDSNTVVANVMGGTVDATVGITLGQKAGVTVKSQWASTGAGQVIVTPVRFRYVQFQLDPARTEQPALLDRRVRQAMAYGIDRATLAETVTEGTSGVADVPVSPNDTLFPSVDRAIAKYPYDPNRAQTLLQQAGWTRRGDTLSDETGQSFAVDIRTTAGADNETEASIMASDLVKLGMQATQTVAAQSRIRDLEYRVTFPGLNTTAMSIDVPGTFVIALSDQCPTADKRFVGSNRGCWKNPEFDRLYTVASTSLDPAERGQAVVDALKILTEDVGVLGLSYNSENIAVRKGLAGPGPRWPAQQGDTWNIQDWHWE